MKQKKYKMPISNTKLYSEIVRLDNLYADMITKVCSFKYPVYKLTLSFSKNIYNDYNPRLIRKTFTLGKTQINDALTNHPL